MDISDGFNPGEYFEFYMSFLPEGGYLFPKPRAASLKFKIHDAEEKTLFEANRKVGKNLVSEMLPKLCLILDRPRRTNHCLRATAVMYMRRAGLSWETIIKSRKLVLPRLFIIIYL